MTKQTYGPAGKVKAKDLISLGNGKFKVYKKVKNPNKSLSAKLKNVWKQITTNVGTGMNESAKKSITGKYIKF